MKQKGGNVKRIKKPWPTKKAMEQIYTEKLWGENESAFYSGEGSHAPEIVKPYIEVLRTFLGSFERPLVVCDLGCGDFNVGKELVAYTKRYVAVDIVPDLIAYNKRHFTHEKLEFYCVDIATDPLPSGDCAVLRQVLQHLSNKEIVQIVRKLVNYHYVVLTEHLPDGDFTPNKDLISGQGIRLKKQSGVNLLAAPFNLEVKEEKVVLSIQLSKGQGRIVTTIYTLP
ncbi:class I SAM-dependent methyltransferase [Flavobacteriaceae bacterium F08102]|nr:class I SAM-dependent methyltransferase [Flavobacteriaceae bacterium F08102]